jgi:adenosylcobyric acid synthase
VGEAYGQRVEAYEIHHGRVRVHGGEPFLDGCRRGAVWGTTWHGALENDSFRRLFLSDVARRAGRGFVAAPGTDFAAAREARLDALGDLVEHHLDADAVWRLLAEGAPGGMPFIPPGGPRS